MQPQNITTVVLQKLMELFPITNVDGNNSQINDENVCDKAAVSCVPLLCGPGPSTNHLISMI